MRSHTAKTAMQLVLVVLVGLALGLLLGFGIRAADFGCGLEFGFGPAFAAAQPRQTQHPCRLLTFGVVTLYSGFLVNFGS